MRLSISRRPAARARQRDPARRRTVTSRPTVATSWPRGKQALRHAAADQLVLQTREGRQRNGQNVRANVLAGAVKRPNETLAVEGKPLIVGLTSPNA